MGDNLKKLELGRSFNQDHSYFIGEILELDPNMFLPNFKPSLKKAKSIIGNPKVKEDEDEPSIISNIVDHFKRQGQTGQKPEVDLRC